MDHLAVDGQLNKRDIFFSLPVIFVPVRFRQRFRTLSDILESDLLLSNAQSIV